MARTRGGLDQIQAKLSGVSTSAFEEGLSRLEDQRNRLEGVAAQAKKGGLLEAIKTATRSGYCELKKVDVSGRDVSIRAEAKSGVKRKDLERTIASLPGLGGYRVEILIGLTEKAREAEDERLRRAILEASGGRLLSLRIKIVGGQVSIGARASHFWQRKKLRRIIESLPCLADYQIDLEVD
jgi:hypothetical protein